MELINKPDNMESFSGSRKEFRGWFSQAIWGHRLERQQPTALLMEFLGMADAMYRTGRLLDTTTPSTDCRYTANTQEHLRVLLFLNPRIEQIRNDCQGNDTKAWETWLEIMRKEAAVSESFTGDFSYLHKRFLHRFNDMVNRVTLLNKITLDPAAKTKWSQKLLFPIGPAGLYEVSNEKFERDRTVFTRTGEIAYLMLTRASEPIRKELTNNLAKLFQSDTARNRLILSLSPEGDLKQGSEKGGSYLPYKQHPAFDRLAEDINNLLKLNLPNQDVLEHMRYIICINLYIYAVETTNHWLNKAEVVAIPCEIPGPRMDIVRKAARAMKEENESCGIETVRNYIYKILENIQAKLNSDTSPDESKAESLADFVKETFNLEVEDVRGSSTSEVLQKTIKIAEENYIRDTLDGIQALGTGAGLIDRRGTNRLRYAPTDKLLRALVLANVSYPLEEDELLIIWKDRYGIIIGPEQIETLPQAFRDKGDFRKNRERFSNRLAGLGLSDRMSDACTYVRNPYFRESQL